MVHLRILGAAELRNQHDAEVETVLAQPKRLALLAYLALCAHGRFVRRDTVLAMFWPESDEERARGAFRQATRFLRKSLGDGVIVNRSSDEIGIAEGAIWCDATELRRLIDDGQPAAAMELYRGDLLEGLVVSDAPDFQDWLDAERLAMRSAAARAAAGLAHDLEAAGALTEASHWLRRAVDLAPYDENAARRLILLLDRAGDRAGAVATFEGFASRINREFDMDPAPETIGLVEAIRRRTGDSSPLPEIHQGDEMPDLQLSLGRGDGRPVSPMADSQASTPVREAAVRPGWPHITVAIGVTAALIVLGTLAFAQLRADGSSPKAVQPIMVVPFENRTDERAFDPLAEMTADWITHGIATTGAFEVVPSTAVLSTRRHRDASLDDAAALRWLVRETRARSVVTGAFYVRGDSLTFHARLTRARDGWVLATIEPVIVSVDDPQAGIEGVRQRVLAALAPLDETPTHASVAVRPPSFEAYRAYVHGMEAFVRFDFPTALQHYERAAHADASYPMPLLASAIAHMNLGDYATADSIAQRLETFRSRLGPLEGITLDFVQARLHDDERAAYDAMVRNRALAPGTIGHYQVAEQARRLNRPRESIRVLRELGPERGELRGWIPYWRELTAAHHMLGQHRRELGAARRARALYPDSPIVLGLEVRALAALGRSAAIDDLLRERMNAPDGERQIGSLMLHAAIFLHHHGHAEGAVAFGKRALAWFEARDEEGSHARDRAWANFVLEQQEEALVLYDGFVAEQPDDLQMIGQHGVALAAVGLKEAALEVDARLAALEIPYARWRVPYFRAAIHAHLDDPQTAVRHVREAFATGMVHGPWVAADPNLRPLRDVREFQDLLRPRG